MLSLMHAGVHGHLHGYDFLALIGFAIAGAAAIWAQRRS